MASRRKPATPEVPHEVVADTPLAFEAALAETGAALTMTGDGDGRLVLSLPPASHAFLAQHIGRLMFKTFTVAVLEPQEGRR